MVDPKQDEIEIGDEILLVTVFKEKAHWSKHTVVGVTPFFGLDAVKIGHLTTLM